VFVERETLADIVVNMATTHGSRLGWSHEAIDTYVRAKMRTLREPPGGFPGETRAAKGYAKAKFYHDCVVCALINEVI
jgi:hypothetical protein